MYEKTTASIQLLMLCFIIRCA